MGSLNNCSISIWVNSTQVGNLITVLKVLDNLDIEHLDGYDWDVKSVEFRVVQISSFVQFNLSIDIYMKLMVSKNIMNKKFGS